VAITPDGKTAYVTNANTNRGSGTVSTIDVKTRTKNPNDITVGSIAGGVELRNTHLIVCRTDIAGALAKTMQARRS
jgi:YVTN family beta-propeller protein